MNRWLVGALALLMMVPSGIAQLPGTLVDTDPAGDPALGVADTVDVPVGQRWQAIDYLNVAFDEDEELFHVWFQMADLSDSEPSEVIVLDQMVIGLGFDFRDVRYTVEVLRSALVGQVDGVRHSVYLRQAGGSDSFARYVADLEFELDETEGIIHALIPRELILDSEGAAPISGDQLTNFQGESEASWAALAGLYVNLVAEFRYRDFFPDDGAADFTWDVQFGIEQNGHVGVTSERPFRVSNGEATTFLYQVTVHNSADHPDTIELSASGLPSQWVTTFPQETARVPAGSTLELPVLVTVPFAHAHGERNAFQLRAQSRSDPLSFAEIDLGVLYTPVPQPAGHHNVLYLHSAFGNAYLNTLDVDEAASNEPVGANSASGLVVDTTYSWTVPLSPGLQMGLDVDMDAIGSMEIPISSTTPVNDGVLRGEFVLRAPPEPGAFPFFDEGEVIATFESEPFSIGANGVGTATGPVIPTAFADYWEYEDGMNLVLDLDFDTGATDPSVPIVAPPSLVPGGRIELPLEEFHDDVDAYFASLSGIELYTQTSQQKLVNPGDTVVFSVTAENIGDAPATFDLELTGTHLEWAQILGDLTVRLDSNERREFAMAVQPTMAATDGDLADITLHAAKRDDPNVRSLIRFLAEVDTEEDHPDESAEAAATDSELQSKDASAAWLLPASLVAMGLLARRSFARRD